MILRRRSGIIEAEGGCDTCSGGREYDDVLWTNRKNAVALAAKHARKYNHTTWASQTIHITYNPKDDA